MRQRFVDLFGKDIADGMQFCTINSLSAQIIRRYARTYGSGHPFELIPNDAAAAMVGMIYRELHGEYPTESTIKDIRTGITYIKNMMLSDEELDAHEFSVSKMPQLYRRYCGQLKQEQCMDFDDQMGYALTILKSYPDILAEFQDRYPYLCVDEAQDTSKIQHQIIGLLCAKHGNLFMVGDEDQSIYGFRADRYPYLCVDEAQDTSKIQHQIIGLLCAKHGNLFMVGDEDQSIYGFRAAYPQALLDFEPPRSSTRSSVCCAPSMAICSWWATRIRASTASVPHILRRFWISNWSTPERRSC